MANGRGFSNLSAANNKPKENEKPFGSFGVLPAVHSLFSGLGATAPVEEKRPAFTLSSGAAPVPDPKPMKDLIPGYPDVPIAPSDMPKQGFGATISEGQIYVDPETKSTLSGLGTLRDMKDAQDEYNLNFAGTTGTTMADSMPEMPTLLDSLSGEALGQQMPNMPLGTVATQEQFENQEQFIPPPKLFGIFDPVYASPQKSFDAQLRMAQDREAESGTRMASKKPEPIYSYFRRAYKGGIPDRFLTSFLTRFGYSPEYIDSQVRVNEDGEIVDAQGNLIEDLPNVALIGEKIKQEQGE